MRVLKCFLPLVGILAILVGTAACDSAAMASQVLGPVDPPDGYTTTSVQQLAQEDRWQDQKVFFEGVISKIGCVGCGGVIIADKTWRISTEPEDPSQFRIPVKTGARLKVWGVLRVSEGFREVKAHRVEITPAQEKSK